MLCCIIQILNLGSLGFIIKSVELHYDLNRQLNTCMLVGELQTPNIG